MCLKTILYSLLFLLRYALCVTKTVSKGWEMSLKSQCGEDFSTLDPGLAQLTQTSGYGLPGIGVILLFSRPCVPPPIPESTVISSLVGLFSSTYFILSIILLISTSVLNLHFFQRSQPNMFCIKRPKSLTCAPKQHKLKQNPSFKSTS